MSELDKLINDLRKAVEIRVKVQSYPEADESTIRTAKKSEQMAMSELRHWVRRHR